MPFSAKKVERVTETNEFALHHNSVNNKFSQRNQNKMAKPVKVDEVNNDSYVINELISDEENEEERADFLT